MNGTEAFATLGSDRVYGPPVSICELFHVDLPSLLQRRFIGRYSEWRTSPATPPASIKAPSISLPRVTANFHTAEDASKVAAHRAQREVHHCGARFVRQADQPASGKKPPAIPLLRGGDPPCEGSFVAHNGGILGSRLQKEHSGSGITISYPSGSCPQLPTSESRASAELVLVALCTFR
jgi:hypothetical protein